MPASKNHESSKMREPYQPNPGQGLSSPAPLMLPPPALPERGRVPRETLVVAEYSPDTFEDHVTLLAGLQGSSLSNTLERAMVMRRLQRDYGNRYVQRLMAHVPPRGAGAVRTKPTVEPTGDRYWHEAAPPTIEVRGAISSPRPDPDRPGTPEEAETLQGKFLRRVLRVKKGKGRVS